MFYSRGKISVKGLGERQTYFVEPPDSNVKPDLELVRNDSSIPLINVPSKRTISNFLDVKKEDVLRSPSFVMYKKCTMVTTPSVQFLPNVPSKPHFESNSDEERSRRSSSPGLEMHRLTPGAVTPASTPMTSPRTSQVDSPETQLRKHNRIAPQNSKGELRPLPPTLAEVSESGRTSRNSNSSGSVVNAFISKNRTAGNDLDPMATATAGNERSGNRNQQENSAAEHSIDSEDSSGSSSSSKQKKGKQCVIS